MRNFELYISEFSKNKDVFQCLLSDLTAELIYWKQNPGRWCLLEIVSHLYDEEREDFRTRLNMILESPGNPFPGIDPTGWVTDRNYMGNSYEKTLMNFLNERTHSILWLQSLSSPNWENVTIHPLLGPLSAKMMLANWLAHDYLHIRQISKLKFDYLSEMSEENLSYAGNW